MPTAPRVSTLVPFIWFWHWLQVVTLKHREHSIASACIITDEFCLWYISIKRLASSFTSCKSHSLHSYQQYDRSLMKRDGMDGKGKQKRT